MKRIICSIVGLIILLSIAGCGGALQKSADGTDIDLTKMSSTMVYSEVYNMMMLPENYVGKTIKMNGNLSVYHDNNVNQDYYSCMIADAAACCQQGISFTLAEGYSRPAAGSEITIVGTFDISTEDGYQYGTLRDARVL